MAAPASIPIRLSRGTYRSDIQELRDENRRNGSKIHIGEITVFYGVAQAKLHAHKEERGRRADTYT